MHGFSGIPIMGFWVFRVAWLVIEMKENLRTIVKVHSFIDYSARVYGKSKAILDLIFKKLPGAIGDYINK